MGRSSLSSIGDDRCQLESTKSPDRQIIPRRFPRIGNQFQTRITKSTDAMERPRPYLMSSRYPHLTEKEVTHSEGRHFHDAKSEHAPLSLPTTVNDDSWNGRESRRGGLLLSTPVRDMKQYSTFIQPFVTFSSGLPHTQVSSEAWVQHMIQLTSTNGVGKRKRAQRGTDTRKRPVEEEMIWNVENVFQSHRDAKRRKKSSNVTNGEEEEAALVSLVQHFNGNVPTASLNLVAHLSGGQASKMRKCEEIKWNQRRSKAVTSNASKSWRGLYERVSFPFAPSIRTMVQGGDDVSFSVDEMNRTGTNTRDPRTSITGVAFDTDDLKGAWTSILACGKSIQNQLNIESNSGRKPLVSTLLSFVGNAYLLPPPETCFGTHHVAIEEVSTTMIQILEHVQKAQRVQAMIRDKIFNDDGEGIDSDSLLKCLDSECGSLPMKLPEADQLLESRLVVIDWEKRLFSLLESDNDIPDESILRVRLDDAEKFREEAKKHAYRSKALVQLISKLQKAWNLRSRIVEWKEPLLREEKGSLKTMYSLVKEIHRIKLLFPEAEEVLIYHRISENWIDRANVVIRSKTSLSAIKSLICSAQDIPLDLTEYLDKLRSRVRTAEQWLDALDAVVPFRHSGSGWLEWMDRLNLALQNTDRVSLHELSTEVNRMQVILDEAKTLQVAYDAKNWTSKAKKWLPNTSESKRGKIRDLREHLDKLEVMRGKLPFSDNEKIAWSPEGEKELLGIVNEANRWLDSQRDLFEGHDATSCSLGELKAVVDQGSQIFANLGPAGSRMSRVLTEAETWYNGHLDLLRKCNLTEDADEEGRDSRQFVDRASLQAAVEDAESNISIKLDEALKLKLLLRKVDRWYERISLIAPKRSKRSVKAAGSKLKFADLTSLISESLFLPIDTMDDVHRLQIQLSTVEAWKMQAAAKLELIVEGFRTLQSRVVSVYGETHEFSLEFYASEGSADSFGSDTYDPEKDGYIVDADGRETDEEILSRASNSGGDVMRLIKDLRDGAQEISVVTDEGTLSQVLEKVAAWCVRSFKYLNSPKDIFDKRNFAAFDIFLRDGKDLLKKPFSKEMDAPASGVNERLANAWENLVSGQLQRLAVLRRERESFKEWCRASKELLSLETGLMADELLNLSHESRRFPASTDLVSKVRGLSSRVEKWRAKIKKVLESGEKMSVHDVQDLLEAGGKLKVSCREMNVLKQKLESAQDWLNNVVKYTSGEKTIDVNAVNQLLNQYENLLVDLPEEIEELKQSIIGYCLCRRPYEGFMIGCDHCNEWYHGPCIGITESKAGKFDKFACIRCCTKEVFRSSSVAAVGIIKKWTCTSDLLKARQSDYQKIQRKFRKEKKEVEKYTNDISEAEQSLFHLSRCEVGLNSVTENIVSSADMTSLSSVSLPIIKPRDGKSPNISGLKFSAKEESVAKAERAHETGGASENCVNLPSLMEVEDCEQNFYQNENTVSTPSANAGPPTHFASNDESDTTKEQAIIKDKLQKLRFAVSQAEERLQALSEQSRQRKITEAKENSLSGILRHWVLRVRDRILVPSDIVQAEKARPQFGVALSQQMREVIQEASRLQIADLPDVAVMENHFRCMCWSLTALALIRRKPDIEEINNILAAASSLTLPDEKAVRTMKHMANRANQCRMRAQKALAPKIGGTKPINISLLQEILEAAERLPLSIPETELLRVAIDDKGARHCICGGPKDGLEMLQCVKCNKSFHSSCIGAFASLPPDPWLCGSCGGASPERRDQDGDCSSFVLSEPSQLDVTIAPHAPNPQLLWPPFGLLGSKKAAEILGECSAISKIQEKEPLISSSSAPDLQNNHNQVISSTDGRIEEGSTRALATCTQGPHEVFDALKSDKSLSELNQSDSARQNLTLQPRKVPEHQDVLSVSSHGQSSRDEKHEENLHGNPSSCLGSSADSDVVQNVSIQEAGG